MEATEHRRESADRRHSQTTRPRPTAVRERPSVCARAACVTHLVILTPKLDSTRRAWLPHDPRRPTSYDRQAGPPAAGAIPCWCEGVYERRAVDRLLTAEEIAERLGMRTDWVWAQARAGLIPHIRLGRYRRFRESAVEAWLRELEAKSTAVTPAAPTPLPRRRRA